MPGGRSIPVTTIVVDTGSLGTIEAEVTPDGSTQSIIKRIDIRDIFGDAVKDMAPGMTQNIAMLLDNSEYGSYVIFSLIAETVTGDERNIVQKLFNKKYYDYDDNLLNEDEDIDEAEKVRKIAKNELFDFIDLTITYFNEVDLNISFEENTKKYSSNEIFSGSLTELNDICKADRNGRHRPIDLATVAPWDTGYVIMCIQISDELNNNYMNKLCTVEFAFAARTPTSGGTIPIIPPITLEETNVEEPIVPVDEAITDVFETEVPQEEEPDLGLVLTTTGMGLPQTGGVKTFVFPLVMVLVVLGMLYALISKKKSDIKGRKSAE